MKTKSYRGEVTGKEVFTYLKTSSNCLGGFFVCFVCFFVFVFQGKSRKKRQRKNKKTR